MSGTGPDGGVPARTGIRRNNADAIHGKPKAHRLTFDTSLSAHDIIMRSFSAQPSKSQDPFPSLQGPVEYERTKTYQLAPLKAKPPPVTIPPTYSPYVPAPISTNKPGQSSGPRTGEDVAKERWAMRKETLQLIASEPSIQALPTNLQSIFGVLRAHMLDDGTISPKGLAMALLEFDVQDPLIADDLYSKLDIHKDRKVSVVTIIRALNDVINLNPSFSRTLRSTCFDLVHVEGTDGYIHKAHLDALKRRMKLTDAKTGVTTAMVKVLEDIFVLLLVAEEEKYLAATMKGKGRKKPPALPSHQKSCIPISKMRIAHMDFPMFDKYFSESKELAAAFLPCWLQAFLQDGHMLHDIIMQRIQEVEQLAQQKQKERDGES